MKPTLIVVTAALLASVCAPAQTEVLPAGTSATNGVRGVAVDAAQQAAWKEAVARLKATMAERKAARLESLPALAEVYAANTNLSTITGLADLTGGKGKQGWTASADPAVKRELARRAAAIQAARKAAEIAAAHIELVEGKAVARYGRHHVTFAPNAKSAGAVDLRTPTGEHLRSHVQGLIYCEPASGKSVWLAEVAERTGEVLPPNQVIYRDAFTGVTADLLYEYTATSLEQDVVIRKRLPSPRDFGLDPAQTLLGVVTEFEESPEPRQVVRTNCFKEEYAALGITTEETLSDVLLSFGSMKMSKGSAFTLGAKGGVVPVGKTWQVLRGDKGEARRFLIESVPYGLIQPQLDALSASVAPKPGGTQLASKTPQVLKEMLRSCVRPVPMLAQIRASEPRGTDAIAKPVQETMKLALAGLGDAPGVVLDYVIIDTQQTGGVWFEDALPLDATEINDNEYWFWTDYWYDGYGWSGYDVWPYAGTMMHVSTNLPNNYHQHYFAWAEEVLQTGNNDVLYAWVNLDSSYPPAEVMLQWYENGSYEHRAYWGANYLNWGTDNTASRTNLGTLPAAGGWVRLEVPVGMVGLENKIINGMAFSLYGGRAAWDQAGKYSMSDEGLVGYWRGDGNVVDSISNSLPTLAGNTTYTAGRVGQTFQFDGLNSAVELGNPASLQLQNFTIEAWVKRASPTLATLTGYCENSTVLCGSWGSYGFVFYNDGRLGLTQVGVSCVNSTLAVTNTDWHHVAVSKSPSNVVFVVDGVAEDVGEYNPTFLFGGPYAIADRGEGRYHSFYGAIDEVKVYNRPLSAAEIQAHYAATGVWLPTVSVSASDDSASEPSDNGEFTITRDGSTSDPLIVVFTMGGTAVNGTDYTTISSPVTIPAGYASTTITLATINRPGSQGTRAATLSLQDNAAYIVGTRDATVSITDEATCASAPSGLVGWWKGENNALGSVGGLNGTLVGNTTYVAGKVGQSFYFDGLNGVVNLGMPAALNLQNFTIEAWVKRTSTGQATLTSGYVNGAILCGGGGGYGFILYNDGRIGLTQVFLSSVNSTPALAVTDTGWHHVAVSKSSSSVIFFVDGVAQNVGVYNPTFEFNAPVAVAARGGDWVAPFYGAIDEVSVYNRPLSTAEVQSLYAAGTAGKCVPNPDSDGDGLPDAWEMQYFGYLNRDGTGDYDGDGLSDLFEYQSGTNPIDADTDYDGRSDGQEAAEGTSPTNPNSAVSVRLASWSFDTQGYAGDQGQQPLAGPTAGLTLETSLSGMAVQIPPVNTSGLQYQALETGGVANFNCRKGTVRFWFKPAWTSTRGGVTGGPRTWGRLIEMGGYGVTGGWWSLYLNPDGTQLTVQTMRNLQYTTHLSQTIDWSANQWHEIVLTYGPDGTALYIDGQWKANGTAVVNYPDAATRAQKGFRIGYEWAQTQSPNGQFDNVETFNYCLTSSEISTCCTSTELIRRAMLPLR